MRGSSKIGLAVSALLFAIAGALLFINFGSTKPTSEALIRQALREAEEAAQKRSVSGVMKIVSDEYKDAKGLNKDRLRLLLARAYRQGRGVRYDVRVTAPQIVLDPSNRNEALVFTSVSVFDPGGDIFYVGDGPQALTLKMRREQGRRWLLFPEDRWRIVTIVNLPPLPGGDDEGGVGNLLGL